MIYHETSHLPNTHEYGYTYSVHTRTDTCDQWEANMCLSTFSGFNENTCRWAFSERVNYSMVIRDARGGQTDGGFKDQQQAAIHQAINYSTVSNKAENYAENNDIKVTHLDSTS